ncbi:hypothetical protein JHK87_010342 [Glycine soja]|nr:hypothetical protein JHK87_010342 [Glycine soja]
MEAAKCIKEATRYVPIRGKLYHRGLSQPLLRCLALAQATVIVTEVHEGLGNEIARVGYYWPTLQSDYMAFVRKCDACQRHANLYGLPAKHLHSLSSPWHLYGLFISR